MIAGRISSGFSQATSAKRPLLRISTLTGRSCCTAIVNSAISMANPPSPTAANSLTARIANWAVPSSELSVQPDEIRAFRPSVTPLSSVRLGKKIARVITGRFYFPS
jgi:hypothetical protein